MGRNYDDPLEFLLDGEAESSYPGCTNLTPSPALRQLWRKWNALCLDALTIFWDANPRLVAVRVTDIVDTRDMLFAYDIYQTIAGAGVGIWEGDWDDFFDDGPPHSVKTTIALLQKHLEKVLSKAFYALTDAMQVDADEQCKGPAQVDMFSLNGLGAGLERGGKDFRDLMRSATAQGWIVERTGGGHLVWVPPDRTQRKIFSASTPSDVRAVRNHLANMRRAGFKG